MKASFRLQSPDSDNHSITSLGNNGNQNKNKGTEGEFLETGKDQDNKSISSNNKYFNKFTAQEWHEKEFKQIPRLYSELEELVCNRSYVFDEEDICDTSKYEWKVTSRWIKYEQTVNRTTNKWGEPYVGPILYQELIYLKNSLKTGTIILNCQLDKIDKVFDEVLSDFVNRGQMNDDHKEKLKKIILTQYRSQRAFAGVLTGRKNQRPDALPANKGNSRLITVNSIAENLSNMETAHVAPSHVAPEPDKSHIFYIGSDNGSSPNVLCDKNFQTKLHHLKDHYCQMAHEKYEVEACLIMCGEVEFLERHVIAFIRLMGDNFVYDLDGFRMKIRFIFVFLGPKCKFSYLEIGRCLGSLMNNKEFKAAAYRAKTGHEIIKTITHFSNQSLCIVLPKGDFHKELLLQMIEWVQKKMKKKKHNQKNSIRKNRSDSLLPITSEKKKSLSPVTGEDSNGEDSGNEDHGGKDDPFKPIGCLFGSLFNETKHRYSQYLSDIKDGLNLQCLIAAVFTFTICLAPTLTFGGILADKTDDWFGVNEMLIATAANGLFFAVFSGQPLMIFGSTGPMLVFEEMLFIFCIKTFHIDFLAMRIWVAIWILFITILVLAFEKIRVIHYVTRFTEEIFAFLIACNFLLDVVKKIVKYFIYDPIYTADKYCSLMESAYNQSGIQSETKTSQNSTLSVTNFNIDCLNSTTEVYDAYQNRKHLYPEPNIALISVILLICTFFLAHALKMLRRSNFLGSYLRRTISDVGILFSIFIMVLVDYFIRIHTKIVTQKLDIPIDLTPTNLSRKGWFVSPFGNNYDSEQQFEWWIPFIAFFPAFLIFIILFFEVELIGILLTNKHRKLMKGTGFNLDLLLGALMMTVNSFFGLPWLCAAPVRTLAHWSSLTTYSQSHIPGEKNKLISVREQRITGIIVHIAIGLMLLAKFFIRLIPVPVLFGLLLYFGVVSLSGTQLYDRILYIFTPLKHTPNLSYARGVRVIKRNIFTLIQIISVAVLLVFKSVAIVSYFFPIFLVLLVMLRKFVLPRFYSDRELEQLDDEEEQNVENDMIHDFYELTHLPL